MLTMALSKGFSGEHMTESENPASETGEIWLVLQKHGGQGVKRFELSGENVVIGRDPECAVHIMDAQASREHARFSRKRGDVLLVDMGSARVGPGRRRGKRQQIGNQPLAFRKGRIYPIRLLCLV